MFSASAAHLDRMATVYEDMSQRLTRTSTLGDDYVAQLHLASSVEWSSQAAQAFRGFLVLLAADGRSLQEEAAALAAEASIIAADLREWASIGRSLAAMIGAVASIDLIGLAQEALLRRALSAVDDASSLVSLISDHGGIPVQLSAAVEGALAPARA